MDERDHGLALDEQQKNYNLAIGNVNMANSAQHQNFLRNFQSFIFVKVL